MNHYGTQAQQHWREWLPTRYSQIPDPMTFFTQLGLQVAEQVSQLSLHLAGEDTPGEGYLAKMGRLNSARMRAEEIVLREEVLLEPEPELAQQLEQHEDLEEEDPTAPSTSASGGWAPVVEDPTHPYWQNVRQQRAEDEMSRHLS
jgi:hypothetical protein